MTLVLMPVLMLVLVIVLVLMPVHGNHLRGLVVVVEMHELVTSGATYDGNPARKCDVSDVQKKRCDDDVGVAHAHVACGGNGAVAVEGGGGKEEESVYREDKECLRYKKARRSSFARKNGKFQC